MPLCQGRGRGSRAHGRGSRREKEPERTSGTGNGTDLEERWCSGARGSGGTKHCGTSPGRRVDAILAKKNLGTTKEMAPLVIALGPGFTAGEDVDVIIETKRGHNLGRVIRSGSAVPNTGIPGIIGGYGKERVMHAQAEGILRNAASIGDIVEARAVIAEIETENGTVPVEASLSGLLRGLIRDGYPVTKGFKIADIDPRKEELQNCFTISDKARCIAGSVLEVICGELE